MDITDNKGKWHFGIKPEPKDIQRARDLANLRGKFRGEESPYTSNASKMSKLIKDKAKLVRRSMAVAAVWGTRDYDVNVNGEEIQENVWTPFAIALNKAGFDYFQIKEISEYEHDDPIAVTGLEDLFL